LRTKLPLAKQIWSVLPAHAREPGAQGALSSCDSCPTSLDDASSPSSASVSACPGSTSARDTTPGDTTPGDTTSSDASGADVSCEAISGAPQRAKQTSRATGRRARPSRRKRRRKPFTTPDVLGAAVESMRAVYVGPRPRCVDEMAEVALRHREAIQRRKRGLRASRAARRKPLNPRVPLRGAVSLFIDLSAFPNVERWLGNMSQVWLGRARGELETARVFELLHTAVRALGAASEVVELTARAAQDELRHSELCRELAEHYAARSLPPRSSPRALAAPLRA